MKSILSLILICATHLSFAQNTFEFAEGMCEYTGTFDPAKHTKIELQNTFDLLYFSPYISTNSTAWKLEKIRELDLEALEAECAERINQLETLDFVDTEFWLQAKENRKRELTETCHVQALTIIAYENPDTLMSFETDDPKVNFFRKGLIEGGDALIDAWIEVNRIQKSNNGSPENIQREFDQQYKSPLKMEYARLRVMMFGWWNHVNHLIYHDPQENYYDEFEKLFIEVKTKCEWD
jgi:hypothetical protein